MAVRRALFLLVAVLVRCLAIDGNSSALATDWLDPSLAARPVAIDLGPGWDEAGDMAVQADGKLVVVATADAHGEGPAKSDVAVLRRLPNGGPDLTFGNAGMVRLDFGSLEYARAVAIQPDGRIVVAATVFVWNGFQPLHRMAAVRLHPNGQVDTTFGSAGLFVAPYVVTWSEVADLALQPDGKIVLAGSGTPFETPNEVDLVTIRIDAAGVLDPLFGGTGVVVTNVESGMPFHDVPGTVMVQPDGRIVVAGSVIEPPSPALVRYTPLGSLDTTFGTNGIVVRTVPGAVTDAVLQADGSIVTTGTYLEPYKPIALAASRYLPDGRLDRSFGAGGTTVVAAPPTSRNGGKIHDGNAAAQSLAVDHRGRLVAAGSAYDWGELDLALVRFTASGGLDRSLGRAGWIKTDANPGVPSDYSQLVSVAVLADGSIAGVGRSQHDGTEELVFVRYPPSDGAAAGKASGLNASGQLGDGSTGDARSPRSVAGLPSSQILAGGAAHSLAVDDRGRVYAWGWNALGQLGDGTIEDRSRAAPVPGLAGVTQIAAGYFHSLAVQGGLVYAWGWNAVGQLGDGTTIERHEPAVVPGIDGVVAVAGGVYHSLALRNDGTVWAWGWNGLGQLGDGTTDERRRPVRVSDLEGIVAIAAGAYHSYAIGRDGTLWAWGWNGFGQLGDGTTTERHRPVSVYTPQALVGIASGAHHGLALGDDGTVLAWGFNALGQVGDGTAIGRLSPAPVPGLTDITAVAAGLVHSLALGADGRIRAWGWNGYGQLANDSTVIQYSPVVTAGSALAYGVAAGAFHSLALTRTP